MTGIPDDIMREAERVWFSDMNFANPRPRKIAAIARALLAAEKRGAERAAKACDRVAAENRTVAISRLHSGDQHSAILHMERERTAEDLAAAIRKEIS